MTLNTSKIGSVRLIVLSDIADRTRQGWEGVCLRRLPHPASHLVHKVREVLSGLSGHSGQVGSPSAWTAPGPLPYRDDPLPPPYWWATDFYRRKHRRPRCDGQQED